MDERWGNVDVTSRRRPGIREQARDTIRRALYGACPKGGAHQWATVADLGYGQSLVCRSCDEAGFMDYGR